MIDGIKYDRLGEKEWIMRLFEEEEIVSYLNNRLEVRKSICDAVVWKSNGNLLQPWTSGKISSSS